MEFPFLESKCPVYTFFSHIGKHNVNINTSLDWISRHSFADTLQRHLYHYGTGALISVQKLNPVGPLYGVSRNAVT